MKINFKMLFGGSSSNDQSAVRVKKPKQWKHSRGRISSQELQVMRADFFRQQLATSNPETRATWEALEDAVASENLLYRQTILDANHITLVKVDMSVCSDQRGREYHLPPFVLSNPTNLRGRGIIRRLLGR